ncbi:MAG: hypothetical protein RIE24_04285 [Silicimonas sp.]|jgi:hypothetical protein|uniref:hypothetical protein n=1 Tax=Roseitalea porphyridii TaxID=1852022 RepID=UPI0032EFE61E
MMNTISVGLSPTIPEHLNPAISYTLDEISVRIGHKLAMTGEDGADIVYGEDLFFDVECWDKCGSFHCQNGLWQNQSRRQVDLIGGVFRLLTLADEAGVTSRDLKGVFVTSDLPPPRKSALRIPLVEHHAEVLRGQLSDRGLVPRKTVSPWPNELPFAAVLTHDVDAVDFSAPQEIMYNVAKAVLRNSRHHRKMVIDSLSASVKGANNPFFAFDRWREIEQPHLSAFYIFHRRTVKRHINDCRSTLFNRPVDWAFIRQMAEAGFEFGAHPSINAKESLDEFVAVKADIEEKLDQPIFGIRHHYWALDWRHPHKTWRKHVNAGFRYDSSIAWRDAAGFRAATSLPYRPWDPVRQQALDIYILPTSIMDGHVVGIADGWSQALEVKRNAECVSGAVVLDWHSETACNDYVYEGFLPSYQDLMKLLIESNAWVSTPWGLIKHWHMRRRTILQ